MTRAIYAVARDVGAAAMIVLAARSTAAQSDSTRQPLACPQAGSLLQTWAVDRAVRADSARRDTTRWTRSMVLDTTITLAIVDRTWQRDGVAAGVALGTGGVAGAHGAPWHACAGASVLLGRVTAVLHGVYGQIHLKADPTALESIGRPVGTTPPAGPPRR